MIVAEERRGFYRGIRVPRLRRNAATAVVMDIVDFGVVKDLVSELSYRTDVATGDGSLAASWAAMFRRHPTRFMVGSDTWVNQRWETYSSITEGYRRGLGKLPPTVAERAWRNAAELFGLP